MTINYQVTARKWRPMVFDDVIGQSHVSDTLRNALSQNRLAHAFIFSGTRGCGKTSTARILARAVNCLTPKNVEPCNECEVCREIIDGRSLDVIEIDGASNRGVDEIRNLRESVRYAPTRGKKKVYIIDEVHMLTKEAFNALLKTLEEPPPHVLFIFATTELHKVPATILSRCQRHDFRRIGLEEIVGRLKYIATKEQITIDDDSLLIIGKKGDGSMRDAQSIFDQVISFCGTTVSAQHVGEALNIVDKELFFRVSDILKEKDTKAALDLVKEVVNSGFDIREFISGVTEHFRNMLVAKTTNTTQLIEESEQHRKRYGSDVAHFSLHDILRILSVTADAEQAVKYNSQPRFKLEVMMVQLTTMESSVKIDELLHQIDELKKKLHSEQRTTSPPTVRKPQEEQPSRSAEPANANGRVHEMRPRYTLTAQSKPVVEEAAPVRPQSGGTSSVTLQQIQQQWKPIVDEMRKKKISVGTILGETHPLDVVDGTLTIACGDDFHRGTLFRNKEILSETINGILDARLRIEPILHEFGSLSEGSNPALAKNNSSPSAQTPPSQAADDNHPLLKKLSAEFGAERV